MSMSCVLFTIATKGHNLGAPNNAGNDALEVSSDQNPDNGAVCLNCNPKLDWSTRFIQNVFIFQPLEQTGPASTANTE